MALAFPDSPTVGDHYKVGDIIWEWDGTVWTITQFGVMVASGGTEVTSGGYKYHTLSLIHI